MRDLHETTLVQPACWKPSVSTASFIYSLSYEVFAYYAPVQQARARALPIGYLYIPTTQPHVILQRYFVLPNKPHVPARVQVQPGCLRGCVSQTEKAIKVEY